MRAINKIQSHRRAVYRVCDKCKQLGVVTSLMPENGCGFDILANNLIRIEVKVAIKSQPVPRSAVEVWRFNIHRHNKISPDVIDFYVFSIPAIASLGFKYGLALVVPGIEVSGKLITVSPRSLISKWAKWINRWDLIKDSCTPKP